MSPLTVWIDFANSPHVLFFAPMIAELRRRGHDVVLTARDFAQTVPLAERLGLPAKVIGRHGGKGLVRKSGVILDRARGLARFARDADVDLAVHHNSYAAAVAARMLKIPSVALMDYEYQPANHVSFRLASKVMVPAAIPAGEFDRYGCRDRLEPYDGIKEDLYVPFFPGDPSLRSRLGVGEGETLAVLRPPPDMAAYHRFHSELFDELLDYLERREDVRTLLMPRTPAQRAALGARGMRRVHMLDGVVDGIALTRTADAVITAGDTMGREAAAAGTPAASLFMGKLGAVDRYLESAGLLTIVSDASAFERLPLSRKGEGVHRDVPPDLLATVVDRILDTVRVF